MGGELGALTDPDGQLHWREQRCPATRLLGLQQCDQGLGRRGRFETHFVAVGP